MTPPSARLNTFVWENENLYDYIDPISKIFILCESIFGFIKLPLIRNKKTVYITVAVLYSVILNAILLYLTISFIQNNGTNPLILNQYIHFILCSILSFFCIKRLELFYKTLNRFDLEVGCKPKIPRHSVQNLVQMIVTIILITMLNTCPNFPELDTLRPPIFIIIFHISCTLEIDFYGHLLNLLVPRLKLINFHIERTLSNSRSETSTLMKEFVPLKQNSAGIKDLSCMRKLMDLYHIIVESYDFLIDAIKWQLLITIISSFLLILGILYVFSLQFIRSDIMGVGETIHQLTLAFLIMIPLFAPCTFGDKVHHEVKRLRELLACRLYENKLDKCGRSIARALLAFTETRDLTFRLLRMLNIDISLPFKFTALLVTYLIILLQFEKVINPGTPAANATNATQ